MKELVDLNIKMCWNEVHFFQPMHVDEGKNNWYMFSLELPESNMMLGIDERRIC